MNSRWATLIAASLVVFASLVITWQLRHYDGGGNGPYSSTEQSFLRGLVLARIPNIAVRSSKIHAASGVGWYYDLVLPKDARVFMTDMIGPTNNNLAWSLAANPQRELRNSREAVQLASKAVELSGEQDPVLIGTLAAVYATDGQHAKAVEMAKKARDIALLTRQPEVAAIDEQLLQLFSAGKVIGSTNGP